MIILPTLVSVNGTDPIISPTGLANQRNVWNILWSCVATIFACTWVAIHPNIPAASDGWILLALRRTSLMIWGLVAPEVIILWAMRQWNGARKIARAHEDKGWTITHGFFLQMGGFMLYDGDITSHPLQIEELEQLHKNGMIDWPRITADEIQDRSKGDSFSKGVVILQTSWFVAQCVLRGSVGLVITELELAALAFAALNTVTYFFWWNKPADVRFSHPIYLKVSGQHLQYDSEITATISRTTSLYSTGGWSAVTKALNSPILSRVLRGTVAFSQIFRPLTLPLVLFLEVIQVINGHAPDMTDSVPTFYAARFENDRSFILMTIISSVVGTVFGGIHCVAWSFRFPTRWEQMTWRVSSLVVTCAPVAIASISTYLHRSRLNSSDRAAVRAVVYSWTFPLWAFKTLAQRFLVTCAIIAYIVGRCLLLVQAFLGLRALSPSALQDMEWTNFIPHF